jgi:catechol 2,3-dioxygenase-like lactoylglutathione lyase family enzyme
MKITNLVLWVQENKLSEKFYKKLGFEVGQSDDSHSILSLSGFALDLVNMRDEEMFARDSMSGDKGRGMYIYIRVDNVDDKYNELRAQGFTPTSEPKDWHWGNREFILKDPDGYKLCFWQPINRQEKI